MSKYLYVQVFINEMSTSGNLSSFLRNSTEAGSDDEQQDGPH